MRVAVIGSRDFKDEEFIWYNLDEINLKLDISLIVSGGARGVDTIGVDWAKERGIPFKEYLADWKDMSEPCLTKYGSYGPYNALAGFKRNTTIIENCDLVIAFWNGKSPGTKDSIMKAENLGKEVIIISI